MKKRIIKNSLMLVVSKAIEKALNLVTYIFIARLLGAESFGVFTLGMAFSMVSFSLTNFGLSILIQREIARDYDKISLVSGKNCTYRI